MAPEEPTTTTEGLDGAAGGAAAMPMTSSEGGGSAEGPAAATKTDPSDAAEGTPADEATTENAADETADGEEAAPAATVASDAMEASPDAVATDFAAPAPPPATAQPQDAPPAPQDAPARGGFFSRMSGLGLNAAAPSSTSAAPPSAPTSAAPSTWGDVYAHAQKRAAHLREQAAGEMERLKAQRERQAQLAKKEQEEGVVIPPSTGTLVVGDPVMSSGTEEAAEKKTEESNADLDAQDVEQPNSGEQSPKKSTINGTLSPLRDALKVVHENSTKAAQQLIFPIDALAGSHSGEQSSYYSHDDSEDDDEGSHIDSKDSRESDASGASAEEGTDPSGKEGIFQKSGSNGGDAAVATTTMTPTRFAGLATIGQRFRSLRETASFDSSHHTAGAGMSPTKTPMGNSDGSPVVGGADRVGGLRHFHLEGIVDGAGSMPPPLPPTMPLSGLRIDSPPGRAILSKQTGGEWTMASNRGRNAVAMSVPYPLPPRTMSASSDAASSIASDAASEDGQMTPGTRAPPSKRASYYEEAVRSVLKPGQRAMFFGKGTMGVILKPTYVASWRGRDGGGLLSSSAMAKGGKRGGVFIDSLIPGGHAEKSGVVFTGDQVIKIGSVNVENMTLEEVVSVIQETKRPNIMILTSEHDVHLVDVSNEAAGADGTERRFSSPLDLAFGFANKLAAEGFSEFGSPENSPGKNGLKPASSTNSLLDADGDGDDDPVLDRDGEEEALFGSPAAKTAGEDGESTQPGPEATPTDSEPTTLPMFDVEDLIEYASHRTNKQGNDVDARHDRAALLKRAALFSPDFRNALRLSLSECVADPRRYSFLEHFFRNYRSKKAQGDREGMVDDEDATSSKNQRRLLDLYVELCKFHDAAAVCSDSDREKLLDYARTISRLFLTEDSSPDQATKGCLPEYVAHVALGGTEKVQAVRFALKDEDEFFGDERGSDGFHDIRCSLESFLSTQESYISFLISDDCSRMRAYLRGSTPYLSVKPESFLKSSAEGSRNHNILLHAILHLICMRENDDEGKEKDENFIKNDALLLNTGKRNTGAASLIGCAIFIKRSVEKSTEAVVEGLIEDGMTGTSNNLPLYKALIKDLEFLWEVFIAPACGSLATVALSQDAQAALDAARRMLVSSVDKVVAEEKPSDEPSAVAMARVLSSVEVSSSVQSLAEALLREYTLKVYPTFCRHIFHEWACQEAAERSRLSSSSDEYLVPSEFGGLPVGWMNRFLRQMEFPHGISLHRPSPISSLPDETAISAQVKLNGDVALVFGSDAGDEADAETPSNDNIRRFSCVSLQPEMDAPRNNTLLPDDIPPIFESYAMVPPFNERPFQGMLQDARNGRISVDGWEVSLTNFVLPSQGSGGTGDDKWMYCVSLVLHKSTAARPKISEQEINDQCVSELQPDDSVSKVTGPDFESPLYAAKSEDRGQSRKMKVSQELKEFNKHLQGSKWSQERQSSTIGIALISSQNTTIAMRETLSLFYNDLCSVKSQGKSPQYICQPLVDILGVLSQPEVETASLGCLLQPYVAHTASRWIQRPLSDQSNIFMETAGMQLLQALPPVPLALAFVTLLLEQKVVFSSSRRGVLMSTSFAMMQLLQPLKWAHLHVPLVPNSMMNELIHYPAPFLLGIPTDEKESAAILSTLPNDVTLVDLDVGRVILSSVFANDASSTDGEGEHVTGALRSQVLFLAESLGGAFGAAMYRNSWCSDSPLQSLSDDKSITGTPCADSFSGVLTICEDFVSELVSGIHSCCLWIEEGHSSETRSRPEPAIIFDEDRFFHVKNLRARGRYLPLVQKSSEDANRSLSLDHFDLIFETFLRTQSLSSYISDGNKTSMSFW